MAKRRQLSKRQLAVIDDMFAGELDEQAILKKHGVSRRAFNRWLREDVFMAELNRRLQWLNLQSELLIARYKTLAAAKLVQLTDSESQETARKACLDIISLPQEEAKKRQMQSESGQAGEQESQQLSDETASKLLAALAEEKKDDTR